MAVDAAKFSRVPPLQHPMVDLKTGLATPPWTHWFQGLIPLAMAVQQGTRATQPPADTVPIGTLYGVTDEGIIERSNGVIWIVYGTADGVVDPEDEDAMAVACKTATIDLASTGTVVDAVAGKRIKVFAIKIVVDADLSVAWRSGGSTLLEGAQTLAENGGYTESVAPPNFLLATTAGSALVLVITGTGHARGRVSYWDTDAS